MAEANLIGGSAADRARILELHEKYIDVNSRFDWENLEPIWSAAPEALFFNLNGLLGFGLGFAPCRGQFRLLLLQFETCLLKLDPLMLFGRVGVHNSSERRLTSV